MDTKTVLNTDIKKDRIERIIESLKSKMDIEKKGIVYKLGEKKRLDKPPIRFKLITKKQKRRKGGFFGIKVEF